MNPVRKRLKLSPSKPQHGLSSTNNAQKVTSPKFISHDALLPSPAAPAEPRDEQEEEESYLFVEEDTTHSSLIITMEDSPMEGKATRRKVVRKKKKTLNEEEDVKRGRTSETEEEDDAAVEVEIDRQLDQSLETKSKQHNLTTVNVRNILHEVITNEHVVAMMKAAINETEAVPPFEPKMTRSKFKEVVEKGVVIPTWNISPIKKSSDANKAPQFVDIPLYEEDSSDEEYCPDEEEEDETAEDTFHESDMESTASSPRGSRLNRVEEDSCSPWQASRGRRRRSKVGTMGPPPPPKALPPKTVTDSAFLEKLHAVEEELAVCMEPYQPLSESEDEAGVMACRTRSKRPLRDVPLGQLEAELQAPDITPDMYDSSSTHEDREWTDWLRGLMNTDVDNEEECDDEDDPEYNFLADVDEPDVEDYRDDKAVRITKKEVNELMEELFETLKEDLAGHELDDEGHEEEEEPQEETQTTQSPEESHIGPPDNEEDYGPTTELRTVKQQLALIRKRRQTNSQYNTNTQCQEPYTLKLNAQEKRRLQQQMQQHVQLLTQIHLLTSPVPKLHSEAETTRQFLFELDMLAQRGELIRAAGYPGFCSVFRASNLQVALELLEELRETPITYQPQHHPPDARGHMRCYPVMPAELAWLFATRPVFLYPELLPCASLDPALYCPRRTAAFTAAEDCLLVLGLRNMGGASDPPKLVSQFLLRKTLMQVRRRILQCCRPGFPDNIVKAFRYQQVLWPMPVACRHLSPAERRPPVEREESVMPMWLVRSLPVVYPTVKHFNNPSGPAPEAPASCRRDKPRQSHLAFLHSAYTFPPGTRYPPRLPNNLDFKRIGFVSLQQALPPPPRHSSTCPLSDRPVNGCSTSPPPPSLSPPRVLLQRLLLTRINAPAAKTITNSTVSTSTIEQIKSHKRTLAGLRRRKFPSSPPASEQPSHAREKMRSDEANTAPLEVTASFLDDTAKNEEEEGVEEESDVLLALSESSSSDTESVSRDEDLADPKEPESEREQGVQAVEEDDDNDRGVTSSDESRSSVIHLKVCEAVQVSPGVSEELLQMLDEFSAASSPGTPAALKILYERLSRVLQPWPQLLKDFAAFLNRRQARRCGLLLEQQLFEQSRRFLWRLGQNLGESSSLYQEVVSMLQGSPAPSSENMEKVLSLLREHPDLQGEIQVLFRRIHSCTSPVRTSFTTTTVDSSQNVPDEDVKRVHSDNDEEAQQAFCAKNITMSSTGEKVIIWTREADRTILTACQQRGANRKTFRQVSTQLGNKTVQQVRLRFQDLMKLFHSASQKTSSSSSEGHESSQGAAPD
ncbi:GON-4-like protein isoform X2 [Cololabis saira]|uniref:GON-4-like protein isoform X2 n=1 Tax=Cololabis saira TaxID=129043 RepID=UPI002AD21F14|nr:GON-4-like protein isoform X2 [Cololabis saira]